MTRNALNFWIDLLSSLALLGLVLTGIMVHFALPAGSGRSMALWGLGRHEWGEIHFWLAVSAVALLLVHLALHWTWVCTTARRIMGGTGPVAPLRRKVYATVSMVLLATLLIGFTAVARQSVRTSAPLAGADRAEAPHRLARQEIPGNASLRGSMTLTEAASALGRSVDDVKQALNLPPETDAGQRLRDLMRQHGFSMSTVREIAPAELSTAAN